MSLGPKLFRSGQVAFHDGLRDLMVPIDDVTPAPWNYNNGDVEEIVTSIQEVGMYKPLVVNWDTKEVIAGNHTWMACKELGATEVPVVWTTGDDIDMIRMNIGDNRIAALARPDQGQLLSLLKKVENDAGSLIGTGYDREQMAEMEAILKIPLDTDRVQPATSNWPTLSIQMPPELLKAFMEITDEADDNRERFEILLKMAGWNG